VLPTPTTNPRGLDIEVFYLGKEMPDVHVSGMDGVVDGLRVSDTVRYTSNFTPDVQMESDQDTLLLWNFTEGSGTSVEDESGNGYTGTVSNAQWSSESDCDL
jgi:hypothetical protein